MLFEKMVSSRTCRHKSDVVSVEENHGDLNVCEIFQKYRFGYWTFDTCSPERLRFSQPGVQRYYDEWGVKVYEDCDNDEFCEGDTEEDHVDIYKLVDVDLMNDHQLEIEEDPAGCMVRLKLLRPNYQLFALRAGLILDVMPISIRLCSVYHYSEVRKKIVTSSTLLVPVLVSECESFLFCSGCWENQSTMSDLPNPYPQAENVKTACKTNNEFCSQYPWDADDWKAIEADVDRYIQATYIDMVEHVD